MDTEKNYKLCKMHTYNLFPYVSHEEREDIVQEAMLSILDFHQRTGREKHCRSAVIDVVRGMWGDSRKKGSKPVFVSLDSVYSLSTPPAEDKYIEREWILSKFKDSGLTVAKLVLQGYTWCEIGDMFGVTQSRISQLLRYHVVPEKKKH